MARDWKSSTPFILRKQQLSSPALILVFVFSALTSLAFSGLGGALRAAGGGLHVATHLKRQVVEVLEEARAEVLVVARDLKFVCLALVRHFEHDEAVSVAELDLRACLKIMQERKCKRVVSKKSERETEHAKATCDRSFEALLNLPSPGRFCTSRGTCGGTR